jgi:hypothetical protein
VLKYPKRRSADDASGETFLKMSPKHKPATISRRKMPGEAPAIKLRDHTKRTV